MLDQQKRAAAYVTLIIPFSDADRAIRRAHEYASQLTDVNVEVVSPDGTVLCKMATTPDGGPPVPSICTVMQPRTPMRPPLSGERWRYIDGSDLVHITEVTDGVVHYKHEGYSAEFSQHLATWDAFFEPYPDA